MNFTAYYHRFSNHIIFNEPSYKEEFSQIQEAIESISDKALIRHFQLDKQNRASAKSLSTAINRLLKENLEAKGWESEVGLFKEPPYNQSNKSRWRLDFAKKHISIEVAFNHQEATAHNIMKPALASELNHVQKQVQTNIGVIIVATQEMKLAGNFDGAIGTYESFMEYFKPYGTLIPTPMVLIGLEAPETFKIDKDTKDVIHL